MTTAMDIKGIGEALLVTVPHGDWGEIEPSLLDAIDERADFFRGAHLVLQLHERGLGASELGTLRDELAARDIGLSAILSSSALTQEASADLGLASELPRTEAEESELAPIATDLIGDDAALIHRTLRSGQTIRHPGHLVVIGDVNPGAEIIAGGNVVIWGRMRGVVHAGAAGDEDAVVCALELAPMQLRIAGHISVSPESRGAPRPEMAYVRDGQVIAKSWQPDSRRAKKKGT